MHSEQETDLFQDQGIFTRQTPPNDAYFLYM